MKGGGNMPVWLIVLLSAIGLLYFLFNGWYTWLWIQRALAGPPTPQIANRLYAYLFLVALFFFALPIVIAAMITRWRDFQPFLKVPATRPRAEP